MAFPTVGIIVPCHNQGQYAAECIDSLHRQTYSHWRAVLLNDASTDGLSRAACAKLSSDKVRFIDLNKNRGRALVRNVGLKHLSQVDYVLNVDCDDYLAPDYLTLLVAKLEEDPSAGLAYGTCRYFGRLWKDVVSWPVSPYRHDRRFVENVIPGGGTMFRRSALAASRGWRADYTVCGAEDYDIWLQVVELGWKACWIPEAAYYYRQHAASFLATNDPRKSAAAALNVLKHFRASIRRTCGVKHYLSLRLAPYCLTALRTRDLRTSYWLLSNLLSCCPGETLSLLSGHYSRRLSSRWLSRGDRPRTPEEGAAGDRRLAHEVPKNQERQCTRSSTPS